LFRPFAATWGVRAVGVGPAVDYAPLVMMPARAHRERFMDAIEALNEAD